MTNTTYHDASATPRSGGTRHAMSLPVVLLGAIAFPLLGGCPQSEPPNVASSNSNQEEVSTPTPGFPNQPLPVPGWVGFATKPSQEGAKPFPFSPVNAAAQIAIFFQDWSSVAVDTSLVAVAPGYKQEVKFRSFGPEPYGCDDVPTPMATFTAATPPPPGPVWLVPPAAAAAVEAVPLVAASLPELPPKLLSADKRQPKLARAWKAGNTTIIVEKETDKKAKLSLAVNSEVVFTTEAEHGFIEGSYQEALDLSKSRQPGIPQPVGAFQFSNIPTPAIVLWRPSFDGHRFEVIASGPQGVQLFELAYAYYCAF
ncbi:MAG TPA: hypothetical protein IGS52_20415 [Oscillatoriaceae cyanobacterium M33_DOE_052]|uniref:Uncharacterized protein n=1 Tax=Planktothricoides sp. SpSt-374 TaxID=2282167 RepID=A0A7C3ZM20_9CYAN|nr:hypothetical protein [Oscillatoriaceae cyanobacterium M33_DOE_052]